MQVGTASFVDPDAAVSVHEGLAPLPRLARGGAARGSRRGAARLAGGRARDAGRMTPGRVLVDLASALFAEWCGEPPSDIRPVAADGSTRSYWRLTAPGGASAVGAHGPDPNENRAFLSFSRTLRELGTPRSGGVRGRRGRRVWLLEDLGDTTLFDAIKEAREPGSDAFPDAALPLYRRVLEILPRFQVEGGERINFRRAYPRAAFDRQSILWDLNYFKYHFLKLAHIPFNEARLERDFSRLAAHLLGAGRSWFLYRDLQSRNVMVRPGPEGPEPWFIDYQGGRRGALQYDVASLLYDSKANLDARHREALLEHYLGVLEARGISGRDVFLEHWPGYVLVPGAAGARGLRVSRFLRAQAALPAERALRGREPAGAARGRPPRGRARTRRRAGSDRRPLEPRRGPGRPRTGDSRSRSRASVSRAGIRRTPRGHGGGHVFDCRGLPNPGREEAYRELTGLDDETIAFIAARPEAQAFWEQVRGIVDSHIANYVERGFHSLSVSFGCTGGQHRSVYMAARLREHILVRHPDVRVSLTHRESADWPRRRRGSERGSGKGPRGDERQPVEAMIFAAGEGRRLRPLTETTPKALVDFGGVPLLERVAGNLVTAGAHRVIVNAHYLADRIEAWAASARSRLGVPVVVSRRTRSRRRRSTPTAASSERDRCSRRRRRSCCTTAMW